MDMSPIGGLTSLLPMAIGLGKVCVIKQVWKSIQREEVLVLLSELFLLFYASWSRILLVQNGLTISYHCYLSISLENIGKSLVFS